jgi:hypothetical protein
MEGYVNDTKEAFFFTRKQKFFEKKLYIYQSVIRQRWSKRIIVLPSDLWLMTKPQHMTMIILSFTMVISNMKAKVYVLKFRARAARKLGFYLLM